MKFLFLFSLLSVEVFATTLNEDVTRTASLRGEIEVLSHEVELLKKAQQSEMDVYIQRDQDLTSQILNEKFRHDQLRTQIQLNTKKLEEHSKKYVKRGSENWLNEFWVKYHASLKGAHPLYRTRLQERLDKLKVDLEFRKISYEHALLQTWFVLETDLKKAQEAEFILSQMQIEDKLFHVEMVRFGRSKGYFRTADGKYGFLSADQGPKPFFFDEASDKNFIDILLTQFKQQEKTGVFQLPGINL